MKTKEERRSSKTAMEQSICSSSTTSSAHDVPYEGLLNQFAEDEIAITDIILSLSYPVSITDTSDPFPLSFSWGSKKKRSVINSIPSPDGVRAPPPSSCLLSTCQVESERDTITEVRVVTSPATPLSFSPSESDEKPKHTLRRKFKKKTKRDLLETSHGLVECRQSLKREVETCCHHLKAQNLESKASLKQELTARPSLEKDNPQSGINKGLNLANEACWEALGKPENQEHYPILMVTHQGPLFIDQTAYMSQMSEKVKYPYNFTPTNPIVGMGTSGAFGVVNHMNQLCAIPDLNISVEETYMMEMDNLQPLDLSRALAENIAKTKAADARKKRMLKIKEMRNSSPAAVKTQRFR